MFVFAHFSDPHLAPLPIPPPWALFNKRFFGLVSWYARKRTLHQTPVLAALIDDLKSAAPNHIVITGDLTNIALPAEFSRVRRWLEAMGSPDQVSVIPGNHDAYVPIAWKRSFSEWASFMSGSEAGDGETPPLSEADFPYVRRRGPVAFIGLNSAAPMPLFGTPAAGVLGERQLNKLRLALQRLGNESLFRVVLIHHPPYPGVSPRKGLRDAEALCGVLSEAGAEVVLHGHLHEAGYNELETPSRRIAAIGLPSASARSRNGSPAAQYHLYRLSGTAGAWELEVEVREVEPTLDRFRIDRKFQLSIARGGTMAVTGPGLEARPAMRAQPDEAIVVEPQEAYS